MQSKRVTVDEELEGDSGDGSLKPFCRAVIYHEMV